jgi:hypothetical protein
MRQPPDLGIGDDALLQRARLAHIEGIALGIEHPVDAGREREGGQGSLDHPHAFHHRSGFGLGRGQFGRGSGIRHGE